jgi:methyltransferase-like protein 6
MRRAAAFYSADFPWESLAPAIAAHEARCAALPCAPPPPLPGARAAGAPPAAAAAWDHFYRLHATKFFHPRSYLLSCFPALSTLTPRDLVLECGAGNGSNLAALLQCTPARVQAGDASQAALAALAAVPACAQATAAGRLRLHFWDVTAATAQAAAAAAAAAGPAAGSSGGGGGDCTGAASGGPPPPPLPPPPALAAAALLLFTLSAIAPQQHAAALRNLVASVAPGGHVCFRDYGLGDLAQLRAPDAALLSASTHRRPDGTLAHYFSREEVAALLEAAGCTVCEVAYHTVANTNRKTGQRLHRVFVHATGRVAE